MNLCKTKEEYINYVAPFAQKACKRYGYLPSVLIAQACLENGFGVPTNFDNPGVADLVKYNNMVGIKAGLLSDSWKDKTVWPGGVLNKDTPETYGNKNVTINDNFRKYDNVEQSFADYLLFMKYGAYTVGGTPKYGDAVLSIKDPTKLIRKVHKLGYATGKTYSDHVLKILKDNKLTKYDDLTGVEPTKYTPGYRENATPKKSEKVSIGTWSIKKSPGYNRGVPARGNGKKYIAVHYLGVDGQNNELWGSGYGAHYFVYWDGTIYNACDHDACPYQVGTAGGTYIQKHPEARNSNCIGIEMCCHNTDGYCPETPTGEKHWYFTEATQKATAWLVRKLMKDLKLDISHVLRHYDVVNKNCPAPYVHNNKYKGTWTWNEFLEAVKTGYCPDGTETAPTPAPTVTNLKQGDKGEAVKTMQGLLIKCGFSCGSAGADGVFGAGTANALKAFQKYAKLDVDGIYGPKSKAALEKMAKAGKSAVKQASSITVDQLLNTGKKTMDTARTKHYKYGDSHATDPTTDKVISCDRLIAKTLYDLGFKDQRKGGEVCDTLDAWLQAHGFVRSTKKADIKKGSILLVTHEGEEGVTHAFMVVSFNKDTWRTDRYDAGSDTRIQTVQPLRNEAWGYRKDKFIVYNIPAKKEPTPTPTPTPKGWKATGTATATVNDLNVRDKAGMEGKILRKLNKGNRFEVDGKKDGNWVHVNVIGVVGWVHKNYIKYD